MLLIQGIGQSYAAQMMTAQATAPVVGSMDVMPCMKHSHKHLSSLMTVVVKTASVTCSPVP